MENKQELIQHLKEQIIKQLRLEDKKPEDIGDHDPLFVEGLGLDSIDALELIVLLQQEYNIKLKSAEEGQDVFRSVSTMADYILEHQESEK
ncbi:phosphopantetheine-binding protein [Niabella soli]|uniref:Acyl carrier protein n=1 Tax=Niabella soli DSM 19437 TaxID=929713 RepID=W0EYP5_9BACT|nr:phosphopantetheine-binding protein [Niabella soli]AHF15902.1 acyl carrier protein [Niabella soli DSM 19437]